jgi:hypothetical protein
VGNLEHLDLQADVRHVVGEVVRDPLLLEGGAGNADRRLLKSENLLIGDPHQNGVRQISRHRRLVSPRRLGVGPVSGGADDSIGEEYGQTEPITRRPGDKTALDIPPRRNGDPTTW